MAGVGRLRTARRRQGPQWMHLVVVAILAAVGGVALWNGLQYSASHGSSLMEQQPVPRQGLDGSFEEEPAVSTAAAAEQGDEGKSDTHANLKAWTKITAELPGSADGGTGAGGDAAARQGAGAAGGGVAAATEGQGFMTVQLRVPKMPPTYNSWVQTEDMLLFHLRALQQQLEQTYVAMGLAAAAGRAFVLPEFTCFCQNSDTPLPRCRRADSAALQFPAPCREGEVLVPPDEFAREPGVRGMPLDVRPASFLQALEAQGEQGAELVLRPSAQILFPKCKEAPPGDPAAHEACTRRSARPGDGDGVLLVPPSLNTSDLLPLLQPAARRRLWRLDFSDVGSHWHAFRGWHCAEPARAFDLRMSKAAKPWPSPHAAAAVAAGGSAATGEAAMLSMSMTSGRTFTDEPDMQECGQGGGASTAAAATRR